MMGMKTAMAKSPALLLATLAAAAGLGGCATTPAQQGYIADAALVDALAVGTDNRESVERALGRPTFVGQFTPNTWYYFSRQTRQLAFANPRARSQQVVQVKFDPAGTLIAVNKAGMEGVVRINPDNDKTPTLGSNRTLIEDIFGNIGVAGSGAGTSPDE